MPLEEDPPILFAPVTVSPLMIADVIASALVMGIHCLHAPAIISIRVRAGFYRFQCTTILFIEGVLQ